MTTQINLKFSDDLFKWVKLYTATKGYMSIQEMIRDVVRNRIFDEAEIKESYKKELLKIANGPFMGTEESKKWFNDFKRKTREENEKLQIKQKVQKKH